MAFEPYEDLEEDASRRICSRCIGEMYLRRQVSRLGRVQRCHYCQTENRRCVSIAWLGRQIDPVYRQLVQIADSEPDFSDDDDHIHWVPGGSNAQEVLISLIDCADDRIASDLIGEMADAFGDYEGIDVDFYDDTTDMHEIVVPVDPQFHRAWRGFCQALKHERRFFSEVGRSVLDQIFEPILRGKGQFGGAVRTIGPQDEERFVFRGRQANDEVARRVIYGAPIQQLGPPKPIVATAGRMNAAGISVFYGSFDPTTCVAELRMPVGGSAVVGKFEIIRPLRLLDLTRVAKAEANLSKFHPDYFRTQGYASFLRGFHDEIKKPVIPGKESLDYLPAQMVAEYLWSLAKNPVDGLIFGSSQVSGDHTNIVLFPKSCAIEGENQEPVHEIVDLFEPSGHPDDGPMHEEIAYFKPVENIAAAPQPHRIVDAEDWAGTETVDVPAAPQPALRLVPDSIQRIDVLGIAYDVQANRVKIREDTPAPF